MKHNGQLEAKYVSDQITALLLAHPELEDDDILRADMIEGETGINDFLSEIVRKIGEAESYSAGLQTYIDQMHRRIGRLEGRITALRSLIFKIMSAGDLKSVKLAEATLTIRAGTAKVIIVDEKLIPTLFMRVKREPDKKLIKEALLAGSPVAGAELSNAEPVLSIHT